MPILACLISFLLVRLVLVGLTFYLPAAPLSQVPHAPTSAAHAHFTFPASASKAAPLAAWKPALPQF
ncbi:hypothetical protein [Hymenobacter volaticus]|uniref:Secreted protein n=1 Tax=Hymenobacter volaticus TaxID=2932254 RepID=A0ABY4G133_9BACT|nr:hypothetical protein [Hymenobacter volaticus]UOQ64384.1 hypothetical protein MUN86_12365 [Hymenobacter volaticus]